MEVLLRKYMIWVMLLLGQLHGYKSCVEKERNALLELKRYFISITEEEVSDTNVLPTWTNDTKSDCCRWEGVNCHLTTQRVTAIVFGNLNLKENSVLNISLLHPFEDVRDLDLSTNDLNGFFDDVEGYKSLGRLRNLEFLNLASNHFNNSIFPFLNAATSLTTLFLRDNDLDGPFPAKELKDLANLELLDLSDNGINDSIPIGVLPAMRKLKALDLSDNKFSASNGLQGICEMTNMQELDLSENYLVGSFPSCLLGLTGLRVLDLSLNKLTGELPPALGNLESLKYLALLDNKFEGFFSLGSLANLSELRVFQLNSDSKSLHVVSEGSWKPKFQLEVFEVPSCNMVQVPSFLLYQKDLIRINLSDNKVFGEFPHWLLKNNTKLEVLLLQNNFLTSFQLQESVHHLSFLDVSANDFNDLLPDNIGLVLPHLQYMKLADNNFQGCLPSSLGNMEKIEYLDISHNNFHGKLPTSFVMGCYSLRILKLSHNKLSGEVFMEPLNFTNIWELCMDNNLFTGKIGQALPGLGSVTLFDISNNRLTGVIPSWIGEITSFTLLLSNNSLEGEIPTSLFKVSYILDLSANNLSGEVPVSWGGPAAVFLNDNNLSGVIPNTSHESLQVLDLSNNRLSGNIPAFTNLQNIHTILLRGNNLTGSIPHQLCGLRNLKILDLANNSLSGSIPSCFSNTSFVYGKKSPSYLNGYAMAGPWFTGSSSQKGCIYFKYRIELHPLMMGYNTNTKIQIEFETKHRYDTYRGDNLRLLFGMDLSDNELSGDIPVQLGGLHELQALNLSHNKLSGLIPESFSGLKNVENLDLSFNWLHGRIPTQLTELNTLAVFNVSFNNLSGVIPQGRQFNTFDTGSYLGNPLLCGKPTDMTCGSNNFQEPDNGVEADESIVDMVSFYWSLAAAYVTVLLGIFSSLSFDSPWRRFWFYLVDAFIHKAKSLLW